MLNNLENRLDNFGEDSNRSLENSFDQHNQANGIMPVRSRALTVPGRNQEGIEPPVSKTDLE